MRLRAFSITCLGLLLLGFQSLGQSAIDIQKMVQIPPSPEASGFIQYGNTGVNYHLGRPSISVPVYSHSGTEFSWPFLLSYDASGIKTKQLASNVGLGWTLITGGAITRIKLGMADDDSEAAPYRASSSAVQDMIALKDSLKNQLGQGHIHRDSIINKYLTLQGAFEINNADTQADVYSLSTSNGLSTKILWDYEQQRAIATDDPTLKVTAATNSHGIPISWTVVDASGAEYIFSRTEVTEYTYSVDANEYTSQYTSAWFLNQVTSPNGKDVYQFNYIQNQFWQEQEELFEVSSKQDRPAATGHTTSEGGLACPYIPTSDVWSTPSFYKIRTQKLTTVTWNGETILRMDYSSNRLDLPGEEEVSKVSVFRGNDLLKEINLHYSHFGDVAANDKLKVRLKLDSVSFEGRYATSQPSPLTTEHWKFEYNNPGLVPSRDTNGVDYWGFYNGKDYNTHLVPGATWGTHNLPGAIRTPDIAKSVYGSLKKIYYPTGGYEEFHYEGHDQVNTSESTFTDYTNLGSLASGTDTNDPYNFCFTGQSVIPKATTGTITVDNESVNFRVNVAGGPATLVPGEYVLFYLFPENANWDHCYADSLANSGVAIRQYLGNQTVNFPLDTLASGNYRYLIYNSFSNSTATYSYGQTETVTNTTVSNLVGGFRVGKIENKQADGSVSLTREFEYEEGLEITPLNFFEEKTTRNRTVDNFDFTCSTFYRYSSNRNRGVGHDVSYRKVTERITNGNETNGSKVFKFKHGPYVWGNNPVSTGDQLRGKMIEESVYDSSDVLLTKTEYFYSNQNLSRETLDEQGVPLPGSDTYPPVKNMVFESNSSVIGMRIRWLIYGDDIWYSYMPWDPALFGQPSDCVGNLCEQGVWPVYESRLYELNGHFPVLDSTATTQYFNGLPVTTKMSYTYDREAHFQIVEQQTSDSGGDLWITKNFYPDDIATNSTLSGGILMPDQFTAVNQMKLDQLHQINRVIQTEQYKGSTLISRNRNNFKVSNGLVLPESVETSLEGNPLEKRVEYVSYDGNHNPAEIRQISGHSRSFIWAYNGALPVIQAQNISYNDLQTAVSWAVTNMANKPFGVTDLESLLDFTGNLLTTAQQDAWDNFNIKLRAHSSITNTVMLTSMAFNSLKSVVAQTDSNGLTTHYEYDALGRLITVKDPDGNIVNTYQYHLKGQ